LIEPPLRHADYIIGRLFTLLRHGDAHNTAYARHLLRYYHYAAALEIRRYCTILYYADIRRLLETGRRRRHYATIRLACVTISRVRFSFRLLRRHARRR